MSVSGRFGGEGWWLEAFDDDSRTILFASAHESNHKQLENSTAFGALIRVMRLLANEGSGPSDESVAKLTEVATPVQEAFASWAGAMSLGWSEDELSLRYPAYQRHWLAMETIVGEVASPYLRLHAAHAAARVSMQSGVVEQALTAGLDRFALSHIRERDRPAVRLSLLRRNTPDWTAVAERVARDLADHDGRGAPLLAGDVLTAEMFAPELADLWQSTNQIVYAALAEQLRALGILVLSHDGHMAVIPRLLEAAATVAGGRLDLEPRSRGQDKRDQIVLSNIETEGFAVAPPLPARLLDNGTPVSKLVADIEHPHLFLTIRPIASLAINYRFIDEQELAGQETGSYLRRSVMEADGPVVELLPVGAERQTELTSAVIPTFSLASMSLLTRELRRDWGPLLAVERTALLLDRPLSVQLPLWLSASGSRLRYAFLRTESFGRVVPVMVARYELEGVANSHVLLRPFSQAAIRQVRAILEEADDGEGTLVADPSLLSEHQPMLSIVLAHLIGEEVAWQPPELTA